MNVRDFSAVLLCAFVISISVSRSIKNNWMCDLQRTKGLAEKKLHALPWHSVKRQEDPTGITLEFAIFYFCTGLIISIKRYVMMPLVVLANAVLIVMKSGDALSVCLNTVVHTCKNIFLPASA